jgi:Abnormal spindle-like microcephaly-assoc'd, ASPM-SPD-2-Hydin
MHLDMTRAPILEGARVHDSQRCTRSALKNVFSGLIAILVFAAILSTTGCVGVTSKGAASSGLLTLNLSPTSITFGNVTVGQSSTKSVTLTNSGSGILMISGISVSGSEFTASGPHLPLALSAGQSSSINVVFKPTSNSAATGAIAIVSDAIEPTMTVSLAGDGAAIAALDSSPNSVLFGSVAVGSEVTKTVQLSSTGSVTISNLSFSGSGVSVSGVSVPFTLTPGKDANLTITYKPMSAGTLSGSVLIASNASDSSMTISLSGTATTSTFSTLTATPSSITFGNVVVGSESTQTIRLANSGDTQITITSLSPSVSTVSVSGVSLPLNLAAGASANFTAVFKPTTTGGVSGQITASSTATTDKSLAIDLTGNAEKSVVSLSASPSSLSFGDENVGSSGSKQVTVKNTGNAKADISSVSVGGTGFSLSGGSGSVALEPGQSETYTVSFKPTSAASDTGTLTVDSNAAALKVGLSGTGVKAANLTVTLKWDASSSKVSGYYIYRSTKSGSAYTKMNSSIDAGTSFTDSSIAAGETYYYVVVAVSPTNVYSSYSNQVEVAIPSN